MNVFYQENDFDFMSQIILIRTYPIGVDTEVFSFETLEKAWKEASITIGKGACNTIY